MLRIKNESYFFSNLFNYFNNQVQSYQIVKIIVFISREYFLLFAEKDIDKLVVLHIHIFYRETFRYLKIISVYELIFYNLKKVLNIFAIKNFKNVLQIANINLNFKTFTEILLLSFLQIAPCCKIRQMYFYSTKEKKSIYI